MMWKLLFNFIVQKIRRNLEFFFQCSILGS